MLPGPPTFLASLFLSTFLGLQWHSVSRESRGASGQRYAYHGHMQPLYKLSFLASLSQAACPSQQLTHCSLRHFSSRKPSSSREFKPLFLHPVLAHYTYLKPATLWERMKSEWWSSPGTQQCQGIKSGGRAAQWRRGWQQAHSSQAASCFCKLLWPSHPLQPWPNCALLLVSLRADRLISTTPPLVFIPMFLEVGVATGGLQGLCCLWHPFCMVCPQGCSLKWCIFSLVPVLAIFFLLYSQVVYAFYPKHLSGVPLGYGLCWLFPRIQQRRNRLKVYWKDDNMNK